MANGVYLNLIQMSALLSKRPDNFLFVHENYNFFRYIHTIRLELWRSIGKYWPSIGCCATDYLSDRLVLQCIGERMFGVETKRLTAEGINASSPDAEKKKKWPLLAPVASLSIALLVKAHWRRPIQIWQLCLPFYPRPNISDRFFNLAPHFIRIQIFQIDFEETQWTFFNFTF